MTDFTTMSDEQMPAFFAHSTDSVMCGRFLPAQLNRDLVAPISRSTIPGILIKRIAAMVLLVQSMVSAATAQQKDSVRVEQTDKKDTAILPQLPLQIKGRVTGILKEYRAGIALKIRGTDITTKTDRNGRFVLQLPDGFDSAKIIIEEDRSTPPYTFSYYEVMHKQVRYSDIAAGKEIVLSSKPLIVSVAGTFPNPSVPAKPIDVPAVTGFTTMTTPRQQTVDLPTLWTKDPRTTLMNFPKTSTVWKRLTAYWKGERSEIENLHLQAIKDKQTNKRL
ncbi:hypothetical protein CJD36_007905 [Flavipsychrobacter stenotrophus]|uniref:Uncharacterized protein n=1 Tax=Flavipsychrobacter stenotrophus TaxID=2077091 RepID=A0A2S7SXQ2_9BACT|nr:hypothetical protein CJD36_007905 [Flavipsychrobacter stenotrophus]